MKYERLMPPNNEPELVEHLEGWDWDVTTDDICMKCKKNFKLEDKGNIEGYKPWIQSAFWHTNCKFLIFQMM